MNDIYKKDQTRNGKLKLRKFMKHKHQFSLSNEH